MTAQARQGPERRPEVDDWARYGGTHRDLAPEVLGAPEAVGRADEGSREDPYRDYRTEGARARVSRRGAGWRGLIGRRSRSNVLGVAAAVAMVAGVAFLLDLRASGMEAPPSPSPRGSAATASPSAGPSVLATARIARVGITVQLPFVGVVPARDFTPDDGSSVFMAGDSAAVVIDPATGAFRHTPFGGADYPSRLRKWLFRGGLWLSTWLSTGTECGPDCWPTATTYLVDPSTGAVNAYRANTYLVGASVDGVWVATASRLEKLDPSTGDVLASIPWTSSGEPRVGCGGLWTMYWDSSHAFLAQVGSDGAISPAVELDAAIFFGPITVEGQCWMMSGSGGAARVPARLVWLNPDGSVFDSRQFDDAVVVLDGEFWIYRSDGTIQRLEVSSGISYGRRYELTVRPSGNDPAGFFAALGYLWLCEGDQLVVFDVRTGAAAASD
jgi:hypothetical protein